MPCKAEEHQKQYIQVREHNIGWALARTAAAPRHTPVLHQGKGSIWEGGMHPLRVLVTLLQQSRMKRTAGVAEGAFWAHEACAGRRELLTVPGSRHRQCTPKPIAALKDACAKGIFDLSQHGGDSNKGAFVFTGRTYSSCSVGWNTNGLPKVQEELAIHCWKALYHVAGAGLTNVHMEYVALASADVDSRRGKAIKWPHL